MVTENEHDSLVAQTVGTAAAAAASVNVVAGGDAATDLVLQRLDDLTKKMENLSTLENKVEQLNQDIKRQHNRFFRGRNSNNGGGAGGNNNNGGGVGNDRGGNDNNFSREVAGGTQCFRCGQVGNGRWDHCFKCCEAGHKKDDCPKN